jgi:hypothetical protein
VRSADRLVSLSLCVCVFFIYFLYTRILKLLLEYKNQLGVFKSGIVEKKKQTLSENPNLKTLGCFSMAAAFVLRRTVVRR